LSYAHQAAYSWPSARYHYTIIKFPSSIRLNPEKGRKSILTGQGKSGIIALKISRNFLISIEAMHIMPLKGGAGKKEER